MKSLQDEDGSNTNVTDKIEFSPIFGFDKLKDVRTPGSALVLITYQKKHLKTLDL